MGSSTSGDITTRQVIDPWIKGSQRYLMEDATRLANMGYQPYKGARIAGPTAAQEHAYGLLGQATGMKKVEGGPDPWEYQTPVDAVGNPLGGPITDETLWPSNYYPRGFQHQFFKGTEATPPIVDDEIIKDDSPPWGPPVAPPVGPPVIPPPNEPPPPPPGTPPTFPPTDPPVLWDEPPVDPPAVPPVEPPFVDEPPVVAPPFVGEPPPEPPDEVPPLPTITD